MIIRRDFGNVDLYKRAFHYFSAYMYIFMNPEDDVFVDEDGFVENVPLNRNEAIAETYEAILDEIEEFEERLDNGETLSEEESLDYKALKIMSDTKVFNNMVKDYYPSISWKKDPKTNSYVYGEEPEVSNKKDSEEDLAESLKDEDLEGVLKNEDDSTKDKRENWNDEQDTINPLRKASQAVKDLMMNVFIEYEDNSKERITPGFVFYKLLQTISGIDTSGAQDPLNEELKQLKQNFKNAGMIEGRSTNREYQIYKKIESLIKTAHRKRDNEGKLLPSHIILEWKGDNQRGWYEVTNTLTFERVSYRKMRNNTPAIYKDMAIRFNLPLSTVHIIYQKQEAIATLNSIYSVVNSMRTKHPYFAYYEWQWVKDGKQRLVRSYRPFKDEANLRSIQNMVKNTIEHGYHKIKKFLPQIEEASKANSKTNKAKLIRDILADIGIPGHIIIPGGSEINLLNSLKGIYYATTEIGKENGVDEDGNPIVLTYEDVMTQQSGNLRNITKVVANSTQEIGRATSYRGAEKKSKWFYVNSTQAHDTINQIIKKQVSREYLKQPFFKYNPLNPYRYKEANNLNEILAIVEHEETSEEELTQYSSKPISYRKEDAKTWIDRNFMYGFMESVSFSSNNPVYVQQFYTISDKPNITSVQLNVLNPEQLKKAVILAIKQELNRPDHKGIKNYSTKKQFLDVSYDPSEIETEEDIDLLADRILETWKINADSFLEEYLRLNPNLDTKINNANNVLAYHGIISEKNIPLAEDSPLYYRKGVLSSKEERELTTRILQPAFRAWYANYFINSLFLNQLVAGDQALFKDAYDQIKRMSMVFAQGTKGRVNNETGLREVFNVIVAKDISDEKLPNSNFWKRFNLLIGKEYDITDAQGFITPERAANVRKGFSREANLGSAFKPVYSGLDSQGIARGMKYSTIELTDELVRLFEPLRELRFEMTFARGNFSPEEFTRIRELYNLKIDNPSSFKIADSIEYEGYVQRVIDEGNHIDEFVFGSAFKFGAPTNLAVINDKGTFTLGGEEGPTKVELLNVNYRHQLNPRHDSDSKTANMTQLTYQLNTNGLNFSQLRTVLNLNSLIHEMGIEEAIDKFTTDGNIDPAARAKIRRELTSVMEKVSGNERTLEFLNQKGISLNLPFITNKLQQSLLAAVSKKTVEIKHKGAKLVLQSSIGTGENEPKIVFTKNGKPLPEDSTEEPDSYYMEAYVPETLYKSLRKQGLTDEQIFNEPVYANILGFRIPSTELHSAVPLRIKGWYPNKNGDNNIIVPKELVLLHGSDFVDSLYIVTPYVAEKDVIIGEHILAQKGVAIGYLKDKNGKLVPNIPKGFETYSEYVRQIYEENKSDPKYKNDLRDLVKKGSSNEILRTFMETITAGRNLPSMMTPIDLSAFNDMEDSSSVFSYMADLIKLKHPERPERPIQEEGESDSDFKSRLKSWREQMLKPIRNLNKPDDELEMHQDNFRAKALTGNFANAFKIISYIFMGTNDFNKKSLDKSQQPLPKLKEEYHIELLGKKYDGFVREVSDGSGTTIWENLDALINAAIDHVKEQILNIVNATEQTSNVWVTMVSMGMPLKDVSLFMTQPSILEVSNRSTDRNALHNLRIEIRQRLVAKVNSDSTYKASFSKQLKIINNPKASSEDISKATSQIIEKLLEIEDVELSRRNLEVGFTKEYHNTDEFTIKDLLVQLKVLDVFSKTNTLGSDYILKGSLALKSVQQLPGNFIKVQDLLDYYGIYFDVDALLEGQEVSISDDLPFTNVNLANIPNVRSSVKVLDWVRDLLGNTIVKNSPLAVSFSEQVEKQLAAKNEKDLTKDFDNDGSGVLDRNRNTSLQSIRDQFVEYLLSGIEYEDNGVVYDMNTSSYPSVKIQKQGSEHTLEGSSAWIYDFFENGLVINGRKMKPLRTIIDEYGKTAKNKFLQQLSFSYDKNTKTNSIRFNLGSSLDPVEKIMYEDSFNALKDIPIFEGEQSPDYYPEGSFNELQHALLKYAVVDQGLAFGSMNYSSLMNPKIFVPLSRKIDNYLFDFFIGLKENEYVPNKNVNNVLENFILQLALQNKDNLHNLYKNEDVVKDEEGKKPLVGKDVHEGNTIYFDLKIQGNHIDKLPFFVKYGSGAYLRVYQSEVATYYQKIGSKRNYKIYQFKPDLIDSHYRIQDYFNPHILAISGQVVNNRLQIPSSDPKSSLIEEGTILGVYPVSDISRIDLRIYRAGTPIKEKINEEEYVIVPLESSSEDNSDMFAINDNEETSKIPDCL